MKESNKAQETARKKVTRKANPQEAYPKPGYYPSESDEALEQRSVQGVAGKSEVLAHGYSRTEAQDLDMFDNERNYTRVCPAMGSVHEQPEERAYNKVLPSPGYGPKEKMLDQDDEDYGHEAASESDSQDD